MIKIGSGGANFGGYVKGEWYNDHDFILCRLPLAVARNYEQNFWALQHRIRCEKPAAPSMSPLKTLIQ